MDFEVCTWLCALTLAPLVTSSLTTSVCPASEAMCSAVFPFWIRIDRETTARANEWHILINPSTTCLCHPIQRGVLSHWHPTAIPYPLPERCCFRWPVIYLQTHTSFLQSECSTRGFLYPVWTCSQEQRTPCDIKHRHKHLLKLCVCVCVKLTLVAASTLAPSLSSSATTSTCPSLDARCNAFNPFWNTQHKFC